MLHCRQAVEVDSAQLSLELSSENEEHIGWDVLLPPSVIPPLLLLLVIKTHTSVGI